MGREIKVNYRGGMDFTKWLQMRGMVARPERLRWEGKKVFLCFTVKGEDIWANDTQTADTLRNNDQTVARLRLALGLHVYENYHEEFGLPSLAEIQDRD